MIGSSPKRSGGSRPDPPVCVVNATSTSERSAEDEIIWFKTLVYSKYTFLGRSTPLSRPSIEEEFHLLQGVQPLICKWHGRLLEAVDGGVATARGLETICSEFTAELDNLFWLRPLCEVVECHPSADKSDVTTDDSATPQSEEYTESADGSVRCVSSEYDWEKRILEQAFTQVANRLSHNFKALASRFDKRFYDCFLYCKDGDSVSVVDNDEFPLRIDAEELLRFWKDFRSTDTVSDSIRRYRGECRSKLSQWHNVDTRSVCPGGDSASDPQPSVKLPLSFESMIVSLRSKVARDSILLTMGLWSIESRRTGYISKQLIGHLRDIQDDVLRCSCDYSKWVRLLIASDPFPNIGNEVSESCDTVYQHLSAILQLASGNNYPDVFDLCIDVMFGIALRHPNPCEMLECSLKYLKTLLFSYLPHPCADGNSSLIDDGTVWLPRLSGCFESLIDFEYLSLHQPLLINVKEDKDDVCNVMFSTSIPKLGSYVLRVDIGVGEVSDSSNIHKPATTSPVFRICVNYIRADLTSGGTVTFVSDGHHIMVFDRGFVVLDLHSLTVYSFEFLLSSGTLLVYLNSIRFYQLDLCDAWSLDMSKNGSISVSIAIDGGCVSVEEPWTLTPGLRAELIKREIVWHDRFASVPVEGGCLLDSLYERYLFFTRIWSCLHSAISRILRSYKGQASGSNTWSVHFLRYLRLLFEHLFCNLECVGSICTYFSTSESVNAVTLWRLIAESILSMLSILRLSLSVPTTTIKFPRDFLELVATCFVGCVRFRSILSSCNDTERYHLQFDLDSLAHAINMTAISIVSSNPELFTQIFSTLRLDVLVDILVHTVSIKTAISQLSRGDSTTMDALKFLSSGDCLAIFTKRALSPNMSCFLRGGFHSGGNLDNPWWNTILGFFESGKRELLESRVSLYPAGTAYCTCEIARYGKTMATPFYSCCYCCVRLSIAPSVNLDPDSYDNLVANGDFDYTGPHPSMLLSRLLLKHGILFLCLNTSAAYKDGCLDFSDLFSSSVSDDYQGGFERFCDWRGDILFSHPDDKLIMKNAITSTGMFSKDNLKIIEYIMVRLLRYNEFAYGLLSNNLREVSSDIPGAFGSSFYNFVNSLSVVDTLSYVVELFEHLTVVEGRASVVYRTLVTSTNLLPSILHLIVLIWKCIKRYASCFGALNLCMNFVVLQFNSLVHLLGNMITYLFNHCKSYSKQYLMYVFQLDSLSDRLLIMEGLDEKRGLNLPQWLLHGVWFEFDNTCTLQSSLKRLVTLLQNFKYDTGCLSFTDNFIPGRQAPCDGTVWALGILSGDPAFIECLRPGYTVVHPSLEICQLSILAVFIHLLGGDRNAIDFCLRSASQAVLQLLRHIQHKQSVFTSIYGSDKVKEVRQSYKNDIRTRCSWVVNNTHGGMFYLKADSGHRVCYGLPFLKVRDPNIALKRRVFKKRCSSIPQFFREFPSTPQGIGRGSSSHARGRRRRRRATLSSSSGYRSLSVGTGRYKDISACTDHERLRVDIRPHLNEILSFLLHGPFLATCEADLQSERVSTLCRYAMWRCMNVLATLIGDIRVGSSYNRDQCFHTVPLFMDMILGRLLGRPLVCSDSIHCLSQQLWYYMLKTARFMVIRSVGDGIFSTESVSPNTLRSSFDQVLLTCQSSILEKLSTWYLSSGICNLDFASSHGHYLPSWVRMSLPFFALQFSLGLEPMNNSRYATPIFQHLLSTLQPLRLSGSGTTELNSYSIKGVGSIFVLYVSYKMLRLCNMCVNALFHVLWSSDYSKRDYVKVSKGLLYLWVKRASDMHPPIYNPDLRLRLLWSLGSLDPCTVENDLEPLVGIIRRLGRYDTSRDSGATDTGEVILWHMYPSEHHDIGDVSFLNNYASALCSGVEICDASVPIYINVNMNKDVVSLPPVDMGVIQYLGGKVEVESADGVWSPLSNDDVLSSIQPMRLHLQFLLKVLLWTSFSSNLYLPGTDVSKLDISCCLSRLLLLSLRDASSMLAYFNARCDCSTSEDITDVQIPFRYIPSHIDCEPTSTSEGISLSCSMCATNLICRCEIENFWTSVLTILTKEVESTIHYGLVRFILNCLLTTFTLGDGDIDVLLCSPNLGPAFCELFISCARKLGQEALRDKGSVISTVDTDTSGLLSPTLNGMFLYRWLPPLQRSPPECLYATVSSLFQSVLMTQGYKNRVVIKKDSGSDPFSTLPHSDNFVTHRFSTDFEADISGHTLHITRATNMGGIVLFRIPINMGSSTPTHGSVNFFILSPGRFGITVAPADCVFGSVMDLFDRNDVVGFMTSTCSPFVHDVFAATINYRVGDVLSASFNIDHQDDGQVCLRTELLIAGNSIGSVLEVVYDPVTQIDSMRRMSLVFIFQDPQTIVYNGLNESPVEDGERLVSRETLSTFRSDTASDQPVDLPITSVDGQSDMTISEGIARHSSIRLSSNDTPDSRPSVDIPRGETVDHYIESDQGVVPGGGYRITPEDTEEYEAATESVPISDKLEDTSWDVDYDIKNPDEVDSEALPEELHQLCKDEVWTKVVTRRSAITSAKSAVLFADSVQLYQAFLLSNIPLLSGLKEEVVGQMCLVFDNLYFKLLTSTKLGDDEYMSIYDSYSWLCVLGCDTGSDAWKNKKFYNRETKIDNVSDFRLPWLLGSSSTSMSCCSKLNSDSCKKILLSLSHLLSVPILSSSLMYVRNRKSCLDFVPTLSSSTGSSDTPLLIALGHAALLCCVLLSRVLCEKGYVFNASDPSSSDVTCIDQLMTIIVKFLSIPDMNELKISKDRVLTLLDLLGIDACEVEEEQEQCSMALYSNISLSRKDINSLKSVTCTGRSFSPRESTETVSLDHFWGYLYDSVHTKHYRAPPVQSIDGRKLQELVPNPKMFSTCDSYYHSSARVPAANRHILRRTLRPNIVEHDVYDLCSVLITLSPGYFLDRLLHFEHDKGLQIFRATVIHFLRCYDFNGMDYWYWGYMAGEVSVSTMDQYSLSVDPLYSWQRLFYMEPNSTRMNTLLNILFTELLYSIAMVIHDQHSYHGLSHVVHWILDVFLRHPLCNGSIRNRFINKYIWSVLHMMLVNCSALPCKLAVVTCRISTWMIESSPPDELQDIFMTTQYCATSVLHRISGLCKYYNIAEMDSFTNMEIKRQDHTIKLASAILLHLFASTLSLLLEKDCGPVFEPDDMFSIAQYILIAKHGSAYSQKFIRYMLGISQNFSIQARISPKYRVRNIEILMTKVFITSSRSKSLSLRIGITRPARIVVCSDRNCRRIISESMFYPDLYLPLFNETLVYIDKGEKLEFNLLRQRCSIPALSVSRDMDNISKDANLRIGFFTAGVREVCSPSTKVHFHDGFLYIEVGPEPEISQVVVRNEVIWRYGNTTVCLTLPTSVELLRPYVAISHPNDKGYTEQVLVSRNRISVPVSSFCYYIDDPPLVKMDRLKNCIRKMPKFRSGIGMSDIPVPPTAHDNILLDGYSSSGIVDLIDIVDMCDICSHMALPFIVSVKIQSSSPYVYVGIEWFGLRFLWYADGTVQCPIDPPLFRLTSIRKSRVSISGVGYTKGDLVALQFVPEKCALYFILNNKVTMVLDFQRFYKSCRFNDTLTNLDGDIPSFGDITLAVLHARLFSAIINDDISTVKQVVHFIMGTSMEPKIAITLLETPLSETQPPDAPMKAYNHYNAIYICCLLNRYDILRCLAMVQNINFDRPSGSMSETPLMAAARNGSNDTIPFLLTIAGVDVNAKDCFGNTALMYALMDSGHHSFISRSQAVMETVDILIAFGADVLARNNAGSTVLDLLPSCYNDLQQVCRYVIEQYNIQQAFRPEYYHFHYAWPGLLSGSEFIFGIGNFNTISEPGIVEIQSIIIDGREILIQDGESQKTDFGEHTTLSWNCNLEYLESIMEKIRLAILKVASKIPSVESSDIRFLTSTVRFNQHVSMGDEVKIILQGFVHDLQLYYEWTKSTVLSKFVKLATEFCDHILKLRNNSDVVMSVMNFVRVLSESQAFPSLTFSPSATLHSYSKVLQGTNLLQCNYSLYPDDYLAISTFDRLSGYLDAFKNQGPTLWDFSSYDLPQFSKETMDIDIRSDTYPFDRLRLSLNREVTKDLDLAIHCIVDLLTNTAGAKQNIAAMVMQCNSRYDLQSRLPPQDSPLWNGIYVTLEGLLDAVTRLKNILTNCLSKEHMDEVDLFMLLQHLAAAVDDIALKDLILTSTAGSSAAAKLRAVVEKMGIGDVIATSDDGEMRITNYSRMNEESSPTRNSDFLSHWSYEAGNSVIAAFCYILISDRILFLDHVNATFKVLAPIIGTVLNQTLVEYLPLDHQLLQPYEDFINTPPCWSSKTLIMKNNRQDRDKHTGTLNEYGICLGPPQLPVHWSTYLGNRCLIRRSIVNDMYSKIFLALQSLNRERPYFSIRVDRGIAATASALKHTLWFQSSAQILNCNANILRSRSNQRPFMVVFRGEGATDFGGPFQELLSCISNEVMAAVNADTISTNNGEYGCVKCPNASNSYGMFQDTVIPKFGSEIHPMLLRIQTTANEPFKYRVRCGDLGVCCPSGCCMAPDPISIQGEACNRIDWTRCQCGGGEDNGEHCMQGLPMELPMYESLGRLFAMCVCMMNPLNVALNPIVWKKILAVNLSLKDLSDYDKMSSDLLYKLRQTEERQQLLSDLTFSLESIDGSTLDLLLDGQNINVTEDNVDLFVRLATYARLTHCDVACTWMVRGFNAVLPIGRFRMLLDYKLLEFMICGDPHIDLEVLRAHTVSTSIQLKRDLFDVLVNFDNTLLQLFLRFVSGRSRLPPAQFEWSMYVEYEQQRDDDEDTDSRLPTSATCSFRLLLPKYSSKEIMYQRLSYAVRHCMAIDLDAYQVHDDMQINP
ncbi:putative E3 ubiquitin-protein ligase protein [Babesia sp. Xinjiang]|uniref:putative E3 ubiquitin-protein ligase protein n=1 Tax=Babesia sp. Xinjiang TaxID=462227 RepID=UPI000A24C150|nr:putative E3 ubiquitin-protein ligase protein [Babesia sp. Xinjiang]ORM39580.1 putative E3 ubiquitin-protein ligase protein [Babesia sp. Xinjiang]